MSSAPSCHSWPPALAAAFVCTGALAPAQAQQAHPSSCTPSVTSPFWSRLDALCQAREAIESARLETPSPEAELYGELAAHCDAPTTTPDFASAPEAERLATIEHLAEGIAQRAIQGQPAAPRPIERLTATPGDALRTGAGADWVVARFVKHACADRDTAAWLPLTCGRPIAPPAFVNLRRALLVDLAAMPAEALRRDDGRAPQASRESARIAMALLDTITGPEATGQPARLAERLLGGSFDCWKTLPPSSDALGASDWLLHRLALDAGRLRDLDDAYSQRVVERQLRALGRLPPDQGLNTVQRSAARNLRAALLRAHALLRDVPAGGWNRASLEALALAHLSAIESALTAVLGRDTAVSADAGALVLALVRDDAEPAFRAARALAEPLLPGGLSPSTVDAIALGLRLSAARSSEEAEAIVRSALLGLGAWADSTLFDVNADLPRLEDGDFKIVGDLLIGYQWERLGVSAKGTINAWEFEAPNLFEQGFRSGGEVDVWWRGTVSPITGLEGKAAAQLQVYDSSTASAIGAREFNDEQSIMGRGLLELALRIEPQAPWALGFWAGGGLQVERYETLGAFAATSSVTLGTQTNVSGIAVGHLRAQVALVPRYLVSRLRVDAAHYRITRNSLTSTVVMNQSTPVATAESATQSEVVARLFLDAEVARFLGFVPTVNAGFDLFARTSETSDTSSLVPVAGAGIRRVAF